MKMPIHFYRELFTARNLRTKYYKLAKLSAYDELVQYIKKRVKT